MCVNNQRELILRGLEMQEPLLPLQKQLKVCNRGTGEVSNKFPSKCNHHCSINELPNDVDSILEACSECNEIRVYNIRTGTVYVFASEMARVICSGPDDSVLIMNLEGRVLQLRWNENGKVLNREHELQTCIKGVVRTCFVQKFSMLVVSTRTLVPTGNWLNEVPGSVTGIKLNDGVQQWKFNSFFVGKPVNNRAICSDEAGKVFLGDFLSNRFLILDGSSGRVLQVIQLGQELPAPIWKICWVNT